jgi:hypothetical protein
VCHLGNIALHLNSKLKWDVEAERFEGSGSEAANALLDREQRTAWAT